MITTKSLKAARKANMKNFELEQEVTKILVGNLVEDIKSDLDFRAAFTLAEINAATQTSTGIGLTKSFLSPQQSSIFWPKKIENDILLATEHQKQKEKENPKEKVKNGVG